jgi:translation initiation factor 4E
MGKIIVRISGYLIKSYLGEQFEEANMLGAVLSIRGRETIIEVWFNYFKYEKIKNGVAQKFRNLLQLDHSFTVYFKDNEKSLQDKSTLRNAETYSFVQQRKSTYN